MMRPGSKVRCTSLPPPDFIKEYGAENILGKVGEEYTVVSTQTFIFLAEFPGIPFSPERFEQLTVCSCDTATLMTTGCKCGQMERERGLQG